MAAINPVQNGFRLMPIENKVHGGFVFLALIAAIGALLAGTGLYGYETFTFKVGMYTAAGLATALVCGLLYRRHTHISRLFHKALTAIRELENDPEATDHQYYQKFSDLFSYTIQYYKNLTKINFTYYIGTPLSEVSRRRLTDLINSLPRNDVWSHKHEIVVCYQEAREEIEDPFEEIEDPFAGTVTTVKIEEHFSMSWQIENGNDVILFNFFAQPPLSPPSAA